VFREKRKDESLRASGYAKDPIRQKWKGLPPEKFAQPKRRGEWFDQKGRVCPTLHKPPTKGLGRRERSKKKKKGKGNNQSMERGADPCTHPGGKKVTGKFRNNVGGQPHVPRRGAKGGQKLKKKINNMRGGRGGGQQPTSQNRNSEPTGPMRRE